MGDSAVDTWKAAVKLQKSSYLVWTGYTALLTKLEKHDEVRAVFSDICQKKIDWPEMIWDSWIFFENLYGDVESLEECLAKVEKAQVFVNARRAKVGRWILIGKKTSPSLQEAEKVTHTAAQTLTGEFAIVTPVQDAQPTTTTRVTDTSAMDVDEGATMQGPVDEGHGGVKRKAGEDTEPAAKKLRMGMFVTFLMHRLFTL